MVATKRPLDDVIADADLEMAAILHFLEHPDPADVPEIEMAIDEVNQLIDEMHPEFAVDYEFLLGEYVEEFQAWVDENYEQEEE